MRHYNLDLQHPMYKPSRYKRTHVKGLCVAKIFRDDDDDYENVELTYEAEDHGDGWVVYCTRPEVHRASDMYTDVLETLYADGLQNISSIIWL